MFDRANQRVAGLVAGLENELADRLERLDKTAKSWYDGSSRSAQQRSRELTSAASACRRLAALYRDEEESAGLSSLAHDLDQQSTKLASVHAEMFAAEQEDAAGGSPVFSSRGVLADESRTGAVNRTDWDLFLAVEPRQFVAANSFALDDADDMRDLAFNYIDSCTAGNGLSHQQRKHIAVSFLSNVESVRVEAEGRHLDPSPAEGLQWDQDSPNTEYFGGPEDGEPLWPNPRDFGGIFYSHDDPEAPFDGYVVPRGNNMSDRITNVPVYGLEPDEARAEVEKAVPQVGSDGRHRAVGQQ